MHQSEGKKKIDLGSIVGPIVRSETDVESKQISLSNNNSSFALVIPGSNNFLLFFFMLAIIIIIIAVLLFI